jgi:hypothetical protein
LDHLIAGQTGFVVVVAVVHTNAPVVSTDLVVTTLTVVLVAFHSTLAHQLHRYSDGETDHTNTAHSSITLMSDNRADQFHSTSSNIRSSSSIKRYTTLAHQD